MSENYIVINGKRTELTEDQLKQFKQFGIEVSGNKRWRAEKGGTYYFVNDQGTVDFDYDFYEMSNDFQYYTHNYFESQEEADVYARILATEMLLKKYADEHNEKELIWDDNSDWFFLYFDIKNKEISTIWRRCIASSRTVYFSDESIAFNAIDEIGADRITEYLMYPW